MPPANRHNPRRAKSSTSDYSVTEFLAEFPDDAACLEHLWRTRHAPDGEHAHCPKCDAVKANVNPEAILYTDDWMAYKPLSREFADHRVINHSAGNYAVGHIYTNTIEGFFGNLKTGMRGTYKFVSRKWLQSYLDEYAWRHNNRHTGQRSMFHALVREAARQ